jgi:hypothetical protein
MDELRPPPTDLDWLKTEELGRLPWWLTAMVAALASSLVALAIFTFLDLK